jgi:hypothetical protein
MLIREVISAENKLELWKMISDSMWAAFDAQARAELAAKAEKSSVRKPRKTASRASKAAPAVVPPAPRIPPRVPEPTPPLPQKKPEAKPDVQRTATSQAKAAQPIAAVKPSKQGAKPSATRSTWPQSGGTVADASAVQAPAAGLPKPNLPRGGTLLARARGVVDDAL